MIDTKNLNKETKIFLGILIFLFLLSIIFINRDIGLSSVFAGVFLGLIAGFFYLYKINMLEIHKGKEKYKMREGISWKKVSIEMKIYFLILILTPFISLILYVIKENGIIRNNLIPYIPIFIVIGAVQAFSYFYGAGRLKAYKNNKKEK